MEKNDIVEKLFSIYCEVLKKDLEKLAFESGDDLLEKFHIDSLIALQIIVKVEQVFGVIIEDDDLAIEMLKSLDYAVEFIGKNLNN